jgi:hypothetical protein
MISLIGIAKKERKKIKEFLIDLNKIKNFTS